jgi:hypothetical protein
MKENQLDMSAEFSHNVDELLRGARAKDCNVLSGEYQASLEFAERLARTRFRPDPSFQARLKQSLQGKLAQEAGLKQRLRTLLPRQEQKPQYAPRAGLVTARRRLALGGLLVLLLVGGIILGWKPEAVVLAAHSLQDGVGRVLREQEVVLRVLRTVTVYRHGISLVRLPEKTVEVYLTVAEAQTVVAFPIRVPGYLPPGGRLKNVRVLEPSAVVADYRYLDDRYGAGLVSILQFQHLNIRGEKQDLFFEVGEGTREEILLDGKPAILATGQGWRGVRWSGRKGYIVVWEGYIVNWEDGDMVFSLWSTLPREETLRVAASVR